MLRPGSAAGRRAFPGTRYRYRPIRLPFLHGGLQGIDRPYVESGSGFTVQSVVLLWQNPIPAVSERVPPTGQMPGTVSDSPITQRGSRLWQPARRNLLLPVIPDQRHGGRTWQVGDCRHASRPRSDVREFSGKTMPPPRLSPPTRLWRMPFPQRGEAAGVPSCSVSITCGCRQSSGRRKRIAATFERHHPFPGCSRVRRLDVPSPDAPALLQMTDAPRSLTHAGRPFRLRSGCRQSRPAVDRSGPHSPRRQP